MPETSARRARTSARPRSSGSTSPARRRLYPVFDAERGFDSDGDGEWVFPDDVPTDPAMPGFEERSNISQAGQWTVPPAGARSSSAPATCIRAGCTSTSRSRATAPTPATADGDDPSEVSQLFRSDAKYYEPAGAVSWDVSMEATRPEWRIKLKGGDTVSINATYDVKKASWYESMGILPLAVSTANDPAAKDPFDDDAAVKAMYDAGGILTHGRLPENIDAKANKNLKLPGPAQAPQQGQGPQPADSTIDGFGYSIGGYSGLPRLPAVR